MFNINKAQIAGNITKELDLRKTQNQKSVLSFSVATNRSYKDANGERQTQADFHNVVVWGQPAEFLSQYAGKGTLIYVEGEIRTRTFEKDGITRFITEVHSSNVQIVKQPDNKAKDDGEEKLSENTADDILGKSDLPF